MLERISNLSLKQKVGQLFFIGIPGTEIDEATQKLLEEIFPGGICLFSRNIRRADQTRKLLDDLRGLLDNPILSLDQEGGLVDRLRRVITPMPSAKAISNVGTVEDAVTLAETTADVVRMLGFNMNFAPVIDVLDESREKFSNGLQSRAFGKSKEDVTEYASRYLKRLQEKGCLGCVKHFPGIGSIEVDAHDELPAVNIDKITFESIDLYPYKKLFSEGNVHAVMIGHAAYPKLDLQEKDSNGKLLPSSLSSNFIQTLLRDQLGFKGLVLTDDLEMGAIVKNYGMGEASKMAIKAGEDMLLICASPDAVKEGFESVLNAVENGEISEARIDESLQRISHFKSLMQEPSPFDEARLAGLSSEIARLNEKVNYSYGG